jgi:hypothetical protein
MGRAAAIAAIRNFAEEWLRVLANDGVEHEGAVSRG